MMSCSYPALAASNTFMVPGIRTIAHTLEEEMEAFDDLPWPLRRTLDFLPIKISAVPVLDLWLNPPEALDAYDCIERMHVMSARLMAEVEAAL